MAEEITQTAPTAVTPTAEAAPVNAATSTVVEASAPNSSAVTESKVEATAPVATEAKSPTTLLGESLKPSEVKKDAPVEAEKAPEKNKEEGSQSDEPAQLPTYEAFKLPEGFAHDKEKLSDFVKELGELQTKTKAEKQVMQEFGQRLMDKYVSEMQSVIKQVNDQNLSEQLSKVNGWKTETEKLSDKDTILKSAGKSLSYLPDGLKKEFTNFYNETGIGNNATLLRTLAHYESIISGYQKKYESEAGIKPLTATVPIEKPKGIAAKMYGSMSK